MGYADHVALELLFDPNSALVYGKKRLTVLLWRVRAEIKRQAKKNLSFKLRKKQRLIFNYDPLSYSLNFDNGDFGFFC